MFQKGINKERDAIPLGRTACLIILKICPSENLPIPVLGSGVRLGTYNSPNSPKGKATPPFKGVGFPASAAIMSSTLET
jgi:hypothetical protein